MSGSGKNDGSGMKNGNNNHSGSEESNDLDFDNFEYPDSPTQRWLADNADLSPLTVLDNINLKTEFPYAATVESVEKPPDPGTTAPSAATTSISPATQLQTIGTGAPQAAVATVLPPTSAAGGGNAETLLQFVATVPVPDSSATFLDIGTDSFSQSLYDDLGDINLADFQVRKYLYMKITQIKRKAFRLTGSAQIYAAVLTGFELRDY